ncbi:hypothetical protein EVAR_41062_1 [Eumeta japonica]|uniref:Uncharacterized protein n=1 Tax=Eumeta variegata TaxID=151549 RepID=A0A4C1XVL2_EUMVA|nr:hypothetical protein EVAR_41062_1 [Eumeta japonica]
MRRTLNGKLRGGWSSATVASVSVLSGRWRPQVASRGYCYKVYEKAYKLLVAGYRYKTLVPIYSYSSMPGPVDKNPHIVPSLRVPEGV